MRTRDAFTAVTGACVLAVAVFALGGALRPIQAVVAALVALSLGFQFKSRRMFERTPAVLVVLGASIGLTLLQLVPSSSLARLNTTGDELRARGAELAGTQPWRAATMDAPATLAALAFLVTLFGVAVLGLRWSASEKGRAQVVGLVGAACGVAAAIAGIHQLLGAESLYGLYHPASTPTLLGPLLNENHLASLMAVGTVVSAAMATGVHRSPAGRVFWGINALACVAANVATGSRGGVLALIAGSVVTMAILIAQRLRTNSEGGGTRKERLLLGSLPLGMIAICVLLLVVYSSASGVAHQLESTSFSEIEQPRSKFAAWRSSAELIREAPWLGIGRGAFESAFTRVHPASSMATFSHLENEYLQAVVEWGIPGALLLACLLGWLVVIGLRRWRNGETAAAAIGGLVVLVLQSNVDFGVELLGVAVPGIMLVTSLTYVPIRAESSAPWRLWSRGVLIAALLGASFILFSPSSTSLEDDHEKLSERPTTAEIHDSITRHPLDYLSFARIGETMIREHDPLAVRFINQALALHPTHAGLHTIAARFLVRAGRNYQAAREYSIAVLNKVDPSSVIVEITRAFDDIGMAVDAIPISTNRVELVVRTLSEAGRQDIAIAWLFRVLAVRPHETTNCDLLFRLTIARKDKAAAEESARRCLEYTRSPQRRVALARVLFEREAYKEVIAQLDDVSHWHGLVDNIASGWMLLCDSYEKTGQWSETRRCFRQFDGRNLLPTLRATIARRLELLDETQKEADLSSASSDAGVR